METVFLGCFLFGFLMVLASVLLGFAHMALPGMEGAFHAGHDGGAAGDVTAHSAGHHSIHGGHQSLPVWNLSSLLAFLMWFGAAGYAATNWLGLSGAAALIPAVPAGLVGGYLISWFLRFAMRGETVMKPSEYQIEGTIGRVTVSIPEGGTGEIVFSKGDRRRSEGARALDGRPIARDEEVVVVEYQRGIALVQPWRQFVEEG